MKASSAGSVGFSVGGGGAAGEEEQVVWCEKVEPSRTADGGAVGGGVGVVGEKENEGFAEALFAWAG